MLAVAASLWGGVGAEPALHRSHAALSLAAEIIFLRAVTPLYPANQADIIFDITEGNLRDSFDIIKRYEDSMTVGEYPSCRAQSVGQGHMICTGTTSPHPLHSCQSPFPKSNPPGFQVPASSTSSSLGTLV